VQQEVRDPQEFLQNLKIDLYPEEVYIFTPKGEVRSLQRGATPVDFAYMIHTDVGNQCVGARVNGKMVPLRTRLQNGDIVEIITQSGHKPSRDWLTFVVSSRARSKIKHLLPGRGAQRSIELGRRLFEKEARPLRPQSEDAARERGAREVRDRVRRAEAGRTARAHRLRQAVAAHGAAEGGARRSAEGEARPDSAGRLVVKRVLRPGATSDKIKVRGTDDIMVFRAKCCNPDSRREDRRLHHARQGVSVHAATCPQRSQPDVRSRARIDVEWDTDDVGSGAVHRPPDDAGRGSKGCSPRSARRCRTSTPTSRTWKRAPATISRRAST
jgi:GTP pyrophosphokinase